MLENNQLPLIIAAIAFLLFACVIVYVFYRLRPRRVAPPKPVIVHVPARNITATSGSVSSSSSTEHLMSISIPPVQDASQSDTRASQLRAVYYRISQAFDAESVVIDETYPSDEQVLEIEIGPNEQVVGDQYGLEEAAPSIYSTLRKTLSLYRPQPLVRQASCA
jgi:hypothetical protein